MDLFDFIPQFPEENICPEHGQIVGMADDLNQRIANRGNGYSFDLLRFANPGYQRGPYAESLVNAAHGTSKAN
jgi:hypothetical protein